jgi:hypothetical protein
MTEKHEGCQCHLTGNAGQSLDELDFDRGIWSAAMNGEVDRVLALLRSSQNQDANIKDSAGENWGRSELPAYDSCLYQLLYLAESIHLEMRSISNGVGWKSQTHDTMAMGWAGGGLHEKKKRTDKSCSQGNHRKKPKPPNIRWQCTYSPP